MRKTEHSEPGVTPSSFSKAAVAPDQLRVNPVGHNTALNGAIHIVDTSFALEFVTNAQVFLRADRTQFETANDGGEDGAWRLTCKASLAHTRAAIDNNTIAHSISKVFLRAWSEVEGVSRKNVNWGTYL